MSTSGEFTHPMFWENENLPIAVAHRGGNAAGAEKENSLAAVEAAFYEGYVWFETDVVPTRDDKLLAIHGRGFQMHPNKDLPSRRAIQRMYFEDVPRIGGEEAVLLEDLLYTFPDTRWFIDPKVAKSVAPLARILKQASLDLNRVSVGAFSQKRTQAVAAEVKEATGRDVCTTIGPLGAFAVLGAAEVDTSSLEARDRFLLDVLKRSGQISRPADLVRVSGADILNVPYRWVNNSSNLVEVAHELGLHVATWTPNSSHDIQESLDHNADAIMSDNVMELKRAILARDETNPSIQYR